MLEATIVLLAFLLASAACQAAVRLVIQPDLVAPGARGDPVVRQFSTGCERILHPSRAGVDSLGEAVPSPSGAEGAAGGSSSWSHLLAQVDAARCQAEALGPRGIFRDAAGTAVAAVLSAAVGAHTVSVFLGVPVTATVAGLLSTRTAGAGRVAAVVVALNTATFLASFALQWTLGRTVLTLSNLSTRAGALSASRVAELWLGSPLKEEVMCRGIVFAVLANRWRSTDAAAGRDGTGFAVHGPAWFSATLFGLIHLGNAFTGRYALGYVALQVCIGVLVGAFYGYTFARSGSIVPTLAMHSINNVWSSLARSTEGLDLSDRFTTVPLALTLIVYGILIRREIANTNHKDQESNPMQRKMN